MDKGLVEHFGAPVMNLLIWIFVHHRNPINVRQIELLIICLCFEGCKDRFVVFQHFWYRKVSQIVCRVPRKWNEFKSLDQDVDVVFLANKGIVNWCFVGRNYNKILIETRKLTDNISISDNGFRESDAIYVKDILEVSIVVNIGWVLRNIA